MKLPAASPGSKPLEGLTFLLAEDNVTNQLVASQMIKALGGSVEIAADGAIALELIGKQSFDILLVDIEMPRVSGLDVIRSVRARQDPVAAAPIIALTAYAMAEHRTKIIGAGADGLIAKPITSITRFGEDIREIAAKAAAERGGAEIAAPEASAPKATAPEIMAEERRATPGGAVIERGVFDGLAQSMGAAGLRTLLRKAEEDLETAGNQIEMAAETGDVVLMRGASHVVISVAGSVGGVRLQRQAEALNRLAHIEELAAAAVLAGEIRKELDGVLTFIRNERSGA
ncbi:MAG: response regulator [Pseudomonadota bacterium]